MDNQLSSQLTNQSSITCLMTASHSHMSSGNLWAVFNVISLMQFMR